MEVPLLTTGESKAYIALVELGESRVGEILKKSGISHSKVYDVLKRLSKKGLVSTVEKEGWQYFSASDPKQLHRLIEEEKEKLAKQSENLQKVVSELSVRKNTAPTTLRSFEGIKGMKTALDYVLDNLEEEVLILGAPTAISRVGGYIQEWQRKRIQKEIRCKILTGAASGSWEFSWWNQSKKKGLTKTRRSTYDAPVFLVITSTIVLTIHIAETIISVLIEEEAIAHNYRQYFEALWKEAE